MRTIIALVLVVAALLGGAWWLRRAPTPAAAEPFVDARTAPVAVADGIAVPHFEYGLAAPDLDAVDRVSTLIGQRPDRYTYYEAWSLDRPFDRDLAQRITDAGMTPDLTWEPWRAGGGVRQRAWRLDRVTAGDHDAYVRRFAEGVAVWGKPIHLRFAHEMNTAVYPWCAGVNGNTAADYVAAFRHVHDLFEQAGATNVSWVWSVNKTFAGTAPLRPLYPGDDVVDELGIDGYNGGTDLPGWGGWQSFEAVFGPTLADLRAIARKPVYLTEVASAEHGGDKADWIAGFFAGLDRHPEIAGFTWFNYDKEADWRIQSSVTARKAFAKGLARFS